jgi:hypothetical protein
MDSDRLLLDHDRITRAADGMISNHGKDALAEANRRVQTLRSSGCDSAAATWETICELIHIRIGDCPGGLERPRCRMCGSINLEIPEKPTPDCIVFCLDCRAAENYWSFKLRAQSGRP